MSGRQKVVIVGGGVGGLTAAHELIERGFDVEVYERRERCGGKAASVRVGDPAAGFSEKVPGEHGFRFFPGWYRHLPDTLARIPSDRHSSRRRVGDHLVNVSCNQLASYDRNPIPVVLHAPRSPEQVQKLLAFMLDIQKLGLSLDETLFFFNKLLEFLSVPEGVRRQEYDGRSWAEFVQLDKRTPAFRLLASNTQTLIAAKPTEASAYTIATMAVRTLFESTVIVDRVLDGPTSEVWIDPWVRYLEGQGVKFHFGYELDAVTFDGESPNIEALELTAKWCSENGGWVRDQANSRVTRRSKAAARQPGDVDYFVFSIPVEQMAYYVNRSAMMTHYDESLQRIVSLSGSVDWMAGIQFYLRTPLNLEAGHIVFADSEWALTGIDQTQFWRDVRLPREIQSILSVDISEWAKPGRKFNKEAFLCTRREIAEEVWDQLKASLNRSARVRPLPDAMPPYHLDDNIAEIQDRKKQAEYNRAQAARFSADALLAQKPTLGEAPFVFGNRLDINVEPLLVNRPGSLKLRPDARSEGIHNLFLAADYVDTATNLACMEGANEAARRAVNAILDRAGSSHDRCELWPFADNDVLSTVAAVARTVQQGPGVSKSIEVASSAATTARSIATRAGENLAQWWRRR